MRPGRTPFAPTKIMRILYFSKDYSPHDHRFLAALAETNHEVFYLKLENNARQTEDRSVPSKIQQVLWAGGQNQFRWRDLPRLVFDFKRVGRWLYPFRYRQQICRSFPAHVPTNASPRPFSPNFQDSLRIYDRDLRGCCCP